MQDDSILIASSDSSTEQRTDGEKVLVSPSFQELEIHTDWNGLLHVKGKMVPYSPILLPTKSHITKLIIEDIHERNYHTNVHLTLATLREKYWVV